MAEQIPVGSDSPKRTRKALKQKIRQLRLAEKRASLNFENRPQSQVEDAVSFFAESRKALQQSFRELSPRKKGEKNAP